MFREPLFTQKPKPIDFGSSFTFKSIFPIPFQCVTILTNKYLKIKDPPLKQHIKVHPDIRTISARGRKTYLKLHT